MYVYSKIDLECVCCRLKLTREKKNIYHKNLHLYIMDFDDPRHSMSSIFNSVVKTKIKLLY